MASRYKLTYFNSRGRAEVARVIFHYAGVKFEDCRLQNPEDWEKLKPETPFGQIPILEVDGEMFCQSHAICRFLAKRFGIAGKTDLEEVKIDMIALCVDDFIRPVENLYHVPDENERAAVLKAHREDTLPVAMKRFEKFLTVNKSGFFVGDQMTWADIAFAVCFMWFTAMGADPIPLHDYPKCKALVERVNKDPRIASYMARRPKSQY